jgi:hypothetical protein
MALQSRLKSPVFFSFVSVSLELDAGAGVAGVMRDTAGPGLAAFNSSGLPESEAVSWGSDIMV